MTTLKRIVVGDAFKLSSGDPNYYRDLALMWPIILFSVGAIVHLTGGTAADRRYGIELLACAIVAVLLAKEKLLLLLVVACLVAVRCLWGFFLIQRDWRLLAIFLLCVCFVAPFRNRRLSYEWPKQILVVDIVVGISSLGATVALIHWMQP
jgi:hypothetical protein